MIEAATIVFLICAGVSLVFSGIGLLNYLTNVGKARLLAASAKDLTAQAEKLRAQTGVETNKILGQAIQRSKTAPGQPVTFQQAMGAE